MEVDAAKSAETAAPTTKQVKFEIKKWNAVAMWSWDINADTVSSSIIVSMQNS